MTTKKITLIFWALLFCTATTFAQETFQYKGTVSNVKITMTLESGYGNYLTTYTGTYYYDNIRENLSLRGFWHQRTDMIELVEVGDGDVITGFFSLKTDPQKGYDVLTGTWTDLNRKKVLPVKLTRTN
ncbi:MAG: hypothetical protein OHK0045_18560 [Raineya sp.]